MTALLLVLVLGVPSWGDSATLGNCERFPEGCIIICEEATPVGSGEVAPCAGGIIPDEWAEEFLLCREVDLPGCEANAAQAAGVAAANLQRCEEERVALSSALRATNTLTRAPAGDDWYDSPSLWFAVGVLVGAVTVGAAAR